MKQFKKIFLMPAVALIVLLTALSSIQAQVVTDYDGNIYDTVVIGTQTWLKQNLKTTHYNSGDLIRNVTSAASWAALISGARCYYNNDSLSNDSVYGALYNWYAVASPNNLCPSGWKVPSDADWQAAEAFLGGSLTAGGQMKEAGTLHWTSPNNGATNSTGFTGLPGGMRTPVNPVFQTLAENGLWWTSTTSGSYAWSTYMWYMNAGIDHNPAPKTYGFSVRCIKDIAYGTEDALLPGSLKLYPNPSHEQLIIESGESQNSMLVIYNLLGEEMMKVPLHQGKNEINISALPKGIYIVRTSGPSEAMQQKLVKN